MVDMRLLLKYRPVFQVVGDMQKSCRDAWPSSHVTHDITKLDVI
jgi:hypothetical protein